MQIFLGIDMVHDQVEISLLSEVDALKSCQSRLRTLHNKVMEQVKGNFIAIID